MSEVFMDETADFAGLPPSLTTLDLSSRCFRPWPNVRRLTRLRSLSLVDCGLGGTVPAGALPASLTRLDARGNTGLALWGALPAGLRELSLRACALPGVGALPASLTSLDLSNNMGLDGDEVCARLAPLTGLRELRLGSCNLSGELTAALPASLRRLDLSYNRGLWPWPAVGALHQLEVLVLVGCAGGVVGPLPPSLTELVLGGCPVEGLWEAIRPLQDLYSYNCRLEGEVPDGALRLPALRRLNLGSNPLLDPRRELLAAARAGSLCALRALIVSSLEAAAATILVTELKGLLSRECEVQVERWGEL